MTETIGARNAATSDPFLGHTEWWDSWLIISVIAAALVATAIGVTTAGSIISHKREDLAAESPLDQYKLTVDAKVADAKTREFKLEKPPEMRSFGPLRIEKEAAGLRLELARLSTPHSGGSQRRRRLSLKKIKPFELENRHWPRPIWPRSHGISFGRRAAVSANRDGYLLIGIRDHCRFRVSPGQKYLEKWNGTMQRHSTASQTCQMFQSNRVPNFEISYRPPAKALASALKEIGNSSGSSVISGVSAN